jgi:VIT1/CCC1 family predicted Fe2+/Mn2+ transporter
MTGAQGDLFAVAKPARSSKPPPKPPHLRAVVERQPRPQRPRQPLGVVEQVRLSLRRGSRLAFALGVLLGGFVPIATFVISHTELTAAPLYLQPAAAFVAGGLLFSAVTMYRWGVLAFAQKTKAVGFVLLLEGTMVTSHTRWLALAALCYLAAINGVATACNLARGES